MAVVRRIKPLEPLKTVMMVEYAFLMRPEGVLCELQCQLAIGKGRE